MQSRLSRVPSAAAPRIPPIDPAATTSTTVLCGGRAMTPEDRGSDLGGIPAGELPEIIEEIEIEDLAVDGICGVY